MNQNNIIDNQQIINNIINNSINNKSFSHAYLLTGVPGSPLLSTALKLAHSILFNNNETFNIGELINNFNLIVLDAKKENITKDKIEEIDNRFCKPSVSKIINKVYIINIVENIDNKNLYYLLKLLEEPRDNTYAILTSENPSLLLPTIISRTQVLRINPNKYEDLLIDSIKNNINNEDAELLSMLFNNIDDIKENYLDERYKLFKTIIIDFFTLLNNKQEAIFYIEKNLIIKNAQYIKEKNNIRLIIEIILVFLEQSMIRKYTDKSSINCYDDILKNIIYTSQNIENKILMIMNLEYELNFNINPSLLIYNMFINLLKE